MVAWGVLVAAIFIGQAVDGGSSQAAPSPDGGHLTGSLSKSEIAAVIRQHQGEIKVCYEQELARDPTAEGKVTTRFTIAGDGSVRDLNLGGFPQTTLASPKVADCIVAAIRTWRFPHPKGGGLVYVTYPWTFRKSSTANAARYARPSSVEMSAPEGRVSAAETEMLELRKPEAEGCYDREPTNAAGKTTALFSIEPDGSVSGVHLAGYPQTTLWSAYLESCLIFHIKTWRFPPKDGGGAIPVSILYTLRAQR